MEAAAFAERQSLLRSRGGGPEATGPPQLSEALRRDGRPERLPRARYRARGLLADQARHAAIAAEAASERAGEVQLHSGDRAGHRVHPFLRLCASRY